MKPGLHGRGLFFGESVKNILCYTILFVLCSPLYGQTIDARRGWDLISGFDVQSIESPADMHEPDWSAWIATQAGLDPIVVCEVRTRTGKRIDILTADEAIEVEWAAKWYESIGQAVFYGIETNREPAIILLSRETAKDRQEIDNCKSVCAKLGIALYVQGIPE